MINEKDIVDMIADEVADLPAGQAGKTSEVSGASVKSGFFTKNKWIKSYSTLVTGKKLVTESEIRKIAASGSKTLRIPRNAIISPLALEIIQEQGIKIIKG